MRGLFDSRVRSENMYHLNRMNTKLDLSKEKVCINFTVNYLALE